MFTRTSRLQQNISEWTGDGEPNELLWTTGRYNDNPIIRRALMLLALVIVQNQNNSGTKQKAGTTI